MSDECRYWPAIHNDDAILQSVKITTRKPNRPINLLCRLKGADNRSSKIPFRMNAFGFIRKSFNFNSFRPVSTKEEEEDRKLRQL